ncbi:MAG: cyclase family protein [Candidatus Acidulodesulfobacterium acidiphilum]|uniref:Kynurenine formamidase n=1 Tax=Candidatus Acidulodesulfobacterium acidiphilum TaxID=2597224 RepID=A0A520X892_9DELT|nr:MAG: cyclase family protein [Candidatus Acidulodesulfobacterium acidiphilum]
MFIDVSMEITDGMLHWPSDPVIEIDNYSQIKKGAAANNSKITCGVHTGTHIDAPKHFVDDGIGIDGLDINNLIGNCRVIEVPSIVSPINKEFLEPLNIKKGDRLLFKTKNSEWINSGDKNFRTDYVYVNPEASKYMVEKGVALVGVDYLSVEGYHIGHDTHKTLLGAGVVIIEGLNLFGVEPGDYYLMALPVKIKDSNGAPARVILQK